jgi:hypothetical protein
VLSAFWYGVVFVSLFGSQWVVSRIWAIETASENLSMAIETASENLSMAIETAEERGDNGNPYRPPNVG